MDASSPLWTLLAVLTGGAISALTTTFVERSRSRRQTVASTRDERREFYLDIVDRTIAIEDLVYDVERDRDRDRFEALRASMQPLVRASTKALVVAPREVRAALADVVGSVGVAPWTAIEPQQDDINEIHHGSFLGARAGLLSAIRDDLDSDRPTLGPLRRARVRFRDARALRKYMKGGTDAW